MTRTACLSSAACLNLEGMEINTWTRPSACGAHGSCLEVREHPSGTVQLRDSTVPAFSLFLTPDSWRTFLDAAKAGEFDVSTG